MEDFEDKVVLVTGALGNLGKACVGAFRAGGAHLVLLDRGQGRLAGTFPELVGADHLLCDGVDLGDDERLRAALAAVRERFAHLDAVVHTVGGFAGGSTVDEEEPGTLDALMKINVGTTLAVFRAAAPLLRASGGGRLVTVGALGALSGGANYGAYSAAKAAVLRLTEAIAGERGETGIAANCVIPGTIDTPQNREAMPEADHSTWVSPEAIATVIAFLASSRADAVNGGAIPVQG